MAAGSPQGMGGCEEDGGHGGGGSEAGGAPWGPRVTQGCNVTQGHKAGTREDPKAGMERGIKVV